MEKKGVGVRSLVRSTSGVKWSARASRWGLRQVIIRSIIHMDLHKANNKLVGAWLEHFWCTDEPWAYIDSQDSPWPGLGGSYHLPPYSIICD